MKAGEKIKYFRQQKEMSAEKLAEAIGVSKTTIIRFENGTTKTMPYERRIEIARVLNVPVQALEDDEFPPTEGYVKLLSPISSEDKVEDLIERFKYLDQDQRQKFIARFVRLLNQQE